MTKALALALALAAISLSVTGVQRPKDAESVTIVGRVTDSLGCTLPGATVHVESSDKSEKRAATTDSSGEYRITAFASYYVNVVAELLGFARTERAVGLREGVNSVDLALRLAEIADGLRNRKVSGTVRDTSGKPLHGATVSLVSAFGPEQYHQVRTAADGSYTIEPSPHGGQYVVTAIAPNHEVNAAPVVLVAQRSARVDLSLKPFSICSR